MSQKKGGCRVRGGRECWFFTAENLRKPSLKKSNYGFGGKASKVTFEEWRGGVGDNCSSGLFDFVSHIPKRFPSGPLHAPGGDQMLAG